MKIKDMYIISSNMKTQVSIIEKKIREQSDKINIFETRLTVKDIRKKEKNNMGS